MFHPEWANLETKSKFVGARGRGNFGEMGRDSGRGEEMFENGWLHNSDYKLLNCTGHESHVVGM